MIFSSSEVLCFYEKHRGRKFQSIFRDFKTQEGPPPLIIEYSCLTNRPVDHNCHSGQNLKNNYLKGIIEQPKEGKSGALSTHGENIDSDEFLFL